MRLHETEAVVLRRKKITAHDSYLTLFTRTLGRIEVFARGANHPKSALLAGAQPFVYGLYSLSGAKSFQLRSVVVKANFYHLRSQLDTMLNASYLAQVLLQLMPERQSNRLIFESLVNSYALLERFPELAGPIVVHFLAVCLAQMGIKPATQQCVVCDASPAEWFDTALGGLVCQEHYTESSFQAPELVGLLDSALGLPVKQFLNRHAKGENMEPLRQLMEDYLDYHLETHLKQTRAQLQDYL